MARQQYPTFGAVQLPGSRETGDSLVADRFGAYLRNNPHLEVVHKHTFYHLVYFTEGDGEQVIDFEQFPVKKGVIYFMRPGQVHNWHFKGAIDGYVVNFYDRFFEHLHLPVAWLKQFPFFAASAGAQVITLRKAVQEKLNGLFEQLLNEQTHAAGMHSEMQAVLLLQIFITVAREVPAAAVVQGNENYNSTILLNFQELIEKHFREWRLPKQYAAQLYITPNHLNALCKDLTGLPAGELIRNRIILEAKRLLVNIDLSVANIAVSLQFADSSYFVKFFKKYSGSTPEAFRKKLLKS